MPALLAYWEISHKHNFRANFQGRTYSFIIPDVVKNRCHQAAQRFVPGSHMLPTHIKEHLIIGVGNEFRGDDAAGLFVARELQRQDLPGARIVESTGNAAELVEQMKSAPSVFVVDATHTGASSGEVYRFDANAASLPQTFSSTSGHLFGVVEAIALARALGALPPRLIVYAIEGNDFGLESPISSQVIAAVYRTADDIASEIAGREPRPYSPH